MLTMLSPFRRALGVALRLWLIVAALALPSTLHAQETPTSPDLAAAKTALWQAGGRHGLPVDGESLAPALVASGALEADSVSPVSEWSRIAFHSYRDGNAEIYTANGNGTGVVRLTSQRDPDLNPRISPDLSRIVFISKRVGNYEVCTIRSDGSDFRNLTDVAATDAEPAWSPDGARIAFSSNRSGAWAIYVMDADGSNLRQLTSGHDDGSPAWAPDGSLAFLRYVTDDGQAEVRVIRPDGSDGGILATTKRFAQYLAWSPDGKRLAANFDADSYVPNEVTVYDLERREWDSVYSEHHTGLGYFYEPQGATWSPDGERILFALARYDLDEVNRRWALTGGRLASVVAHWRSQHDEPQYWPETSGVDFGPSWVSTDRQPPAAAFSGLAPFSPAGGVPLSWRAAETGGSGLRSFDMEARVDGGPWRPWATDATTSTGVYRGQGGQQVELRVRARDRAYNLGGWSPAVATRLYAGTVTGRVLDARGYPVVDAAVAASPAAMNELRADGQGAYTGFFATTGGIRASATAAGYGPSSPLTREAGAVRRADFVLPPQSNFVAGGGFDGAALDPAWSVTGNPPPQRIATGAAFGAGAVSLGQPLELTEPEKIAENATVTLAARNGAAAMLIVTPGDNAPRREVRWKAATGGWSAPKELAVSAFLEGEPYLALDSALNLHLVTKTYAGQLQYCRIPWNGATCAVEEPEGGGSGGAIKVALDRQDTLRVLAEAYYAERSAAGAWTVGPYPGAGYAPATAVVADAQGNLHVALEKTNDSGVSTTYYGGRRADGTWLTPEVAAWGGEQGSYPTLAVTEDGTVHMTWIDNSFDPARVGSYYTFKTPGGTWARSVRITPSGSRVLFTAGANGPELWATVGSTLQRFAPETGGQWRSMASWPLVEQIVQSAQLDNIGILHLAIRDFGSTWPQINWVRTVKRQPQAQTYALSQPVTIPAGSHAPTLSFFYRTDSAVVERGFRATLTADGQTQALPLHVTGEGGWRHAWADLSAWAGRIATLRFELQQAAGEPLGQASVDEVSVGPWLTPVIERVEAQGKVTVAGRNFIEGATVRLNGVALPTEFVDERLLIALQPEPLKVGRYVLTVVNPGGQTGMGGLQVGHATHLPVLSR